jgi:flagellar operon protein (TIGR03826 family)
MAELANCPSCGQLFVKDVRNICPSCYKSEEDSFEKVYDFIRDQKNRRATLPEVSKATGVKERTIIRFIKEGRIRVADFPNLTYPCESCGMPIREGKLCDACRTKLRKGFQRYAQEEEPESRVNERRQTYFSKTD